MPDEPKVQFIDDRLCFALYSCSKAIVGAYTQHLSKAGITYPQCLVILVLLEHGDLTVSKLCNFLFLDSGTLTPLLKRMETQKLVERSRSEEDERSVVVKLTKAGHDLSGAIAHAQKEVSCTVAMQPDDFASFRSQIKELNLKLRNL